MKKSGIGEGGRPLKAMLQENERLYQETGCYSGIDKLSLKEQDPLKFEIFHSRLLSSSIAAREACRQISAAPVVREVAELVVSLYTPDGDSIINSTGIMIHIPLMGEFVKWMINNNYEEEFGIAEGDVFECNDNAIAGMHAADVYDATPIFWEGECVGWAVAVSMQLDSGAVSPGVNPICAVERYMDGFRVSAEKIATNDTVRKEHEKRVSLSFRVPSMYLLDMKGRIAADIRLREDVKEIIEEFGIDYYKRAIRELIEDERRAQIARIKQRTVPGRYHNIIHIELPYGDLPVPPFAKKNHIVRLPLEMSIEPSGKTIMDWEGAGPSGWHNANCTPSGLWGAYSLGLVQIMSYDGKANAGTLMPSEMRVPRNSFLDPANLWELATGMIFIPSASAGGTFIGMMSRAFFMRGFREEVMASGNLSPSYEWCGYNQFGRRFVGYSWDFTGSQGSGARGAIDGLNSCYQIWNTEADMGSVEVFSLIAPQIWLGRNMIPDSCGFGKYRAGNCVQTTWTFSGGRDFYFSGYFSGSDKITANTGLFGGYPSRINYAYYATETNLKELIEQRKPLVHGEGDPRNPDIRKLIKGKHGITNATRIIPVLLQPYDVYQHFGTPGQGGYGDPIERDPELVRLDLEDGLTTPDTCQRVYCVEPHFDSTADEWKIDGEKTKNLRGQRKKRRLSKGIPVREWWKKQRGRILKKDLEPLVIEMFAASLQSPKAAQDFRSFWRLPEGFSFSSQLSKGEVQHG